MKKNYWDKLEIVNFEMATRNDRTHLQLSFYFGQPKDSYHVLIPHDIARSDLAIKLHKLADAILQVETGEDKA